MSVTLNSSVSPFPVAQSGKGAPASGAVDTDDGASLPFADILGAARAQEAAAPEPRPSDADPAEDSSDAEVVVDVPGASAPQPWFLVAEAFASRRDELAAGAATADSPAPGMRAVREDASAGARPLPGSDRSDARLAPAPLAPEPDAGAERASARTSGDAATTDAAGSVPGAAPGAAGGSFAARLAAAASMAGSAVAQPQAAASRVEASRVEASRVEASEALRGSRAAVTTAHAVPANPASATDVAASTAPAEDFGSATTPTRPAAGTAPTPAATRPSPAVSPQALEADDFNAAAGAAPSRAFLAASAPAARTEATAVNRVDERDAKGGGAASVTTDASSIGVAGAAETRGGARADPPLTLHVDRPVGSAGWAADVSTSIAEVFAMKRDSAELHVHPAHLGPVDIRISLSGEQASVQLVAAHPGTRDALQETLNVLRDMLAEQGLTLGQASIESRAQADTRSSPEPAGGALATPGVARVAEVSDPVAGIARPLRLLDVFA